MHSTKLSLVAAMLLASTAHAHVVLENPKPFKFVADGPTNPVSSTGEDFPCKIPPGQTYEVDGERTVYAVGEEQTATFKGQAVHGGGSCQFALSADAAPTRDSAWMVIHSIEGGCPARNQKGNLEGPNQDKYTFRIPEGIAPGDYVFAWTWQARVGGQPEYYMNCAPITVVPAKRRRRVGVRGGAGGVAERRASLAAAAAVAKRVEFPELFMANMGDVSGGCTTGEALNAQIPIAYPNPGASVDHPEGTANLFKQPCDGNPRAGNAAPAPAPSPAPGDGNDGSAAPTAAPTSAGEEEPATTTASSSSSSSSCSSSSSSSSATVTSTTEPETPASSAQPEAPTTPPTESAAPTCQCPSVSGPVPAVSTVITQVTVTITATTTAEIPAASNAPAPPSPSSAPASCTEGYLTCLDDETHFATCTGGKLTAPQPIAPGFKCRAGEGQGLDISPA